MCQIARENNILILADEIYNQLDYENQYVSIASFENMKDYTIIVNGFSKAYAMTGWRMGYIASSQENIDRIFKSTSIYNNITNDICTNWDGKSN